MKEQLQLKNHLKEIRTEANLSQAQLAEMVGVSRNTISSIETGQFNPVSYTHLDVYKRQALTEKYSKLAAEAKTHSNPENYIHSKYFDKSSEYYETNLTDTERRIASVSYTHLDVYKRQRDACAACGI